MGIWVFPAVIFLIVIVIVFHFIGRDLRVVNDLATCAPATLDNVALIDGVI